jgi:hypothetical protein
MPLKSTGSPEARRWEATAVGSERILLLAADALFMAGALAQ